ncbi:hypothetical protein KR200_004531 [Drosophila serrata]|nr:hypothetical protein KR200_004531 [Drosophila serrata]
MIYFFLCSLVDTHIYACRHHPARAITCYECDSVNNPGCGEQFASDDIATTDCEVVADLRSPGTEPTCLTKYHEGGEYINHKIGYKTHTIPLYPCVGPGESRFVRRSCYYGDSSPAGMNCDEQPDPVVPFLTFLGCTLCNTDLCNATPRGISVPLSLYAALATFGLLGLLVN